ncbi:hypothetical protein Tco_0191992, partial [Tanacetum coccineum]
MMILEKSPEQRSVENSNSKVAATREKKDQQNLAKEQAKHEGDGGSAAPRKKRVRRNQEPAGSGSERTISVTPLRQAASRPVDGTTTSIPKNTTRNVATRPYMVNIEKDVVVVKTLAFLLLRSPSFSLQPMPSMMTPRRTWACKELISHLATPIEEEFLGGLSNVEVV